MRSFRVEMNGGPHVVPAETVIPQAQSGEVLIRVCAAGVIVPELLWYPTLHTKTGETRRDAIPCHEFSGIVSAIGPDVVAFAAGDPVFGMNDWFHDGALAEYCTAPVSAVARKPERLSHEEAASVPISALTAWQGVIERAQVKPGERVLVHGGAGSVGLFAVQLAKLKGAYVIATASAQNVSFVMDHGADSVIDRYEPRFENFSGLVDIVFDTVGGEILERSWNVLKPGGRIVTVVSESENSPEPRVKDAFFIVEPSQQQLAEVAGLLEAGKLQTVVDTVTPFSQAAEVFAGKVQRRGRGKMVVRVNADE